MVKALDRLDVPSFAIPDEPLLSAPSVADLMAACGGVLVDGDEALLAREVPAIVIAAMTMPNVLDRLSDGALVVTPGDRPEVVLGVLTAHLSSSFPQVSGIVLNGGLELPHQVRTLLDGLPVTLPIIATPLGHARDVDRAHQPAWPPRQGLAPQDRDRPVALRRARRRRPAARPARGGADRRP